jgi:hypothetical protein
MRSVTLRLTVLLCAYAAQAQNGTLGKDKTTSPSVESSTLNGNWQVTGDREQKHFPVITMAIHIDGNQVIAETADSIACPSGKWGSSSMMGLTGEIQADGSFTMRSSPRPAGLAGNPNDWVHVTVSGKVPPTGSIKWNGNYTIKGQMSADCILDQAGNFTASPLPTLTGTFSNKVTMYYPIGAQHDPGYSGPKLIRFGMNVTQGDFVSHERRRGLRPYVYVPLTGTIHVEGSPCFASGRADASIDNFMQGDFGTMKFKMDDGSELSASMVYTDPKGAGLLIQQAWVKGGRCDKLTFQGMLPRQ